MATLGFGEVDCSAPYLREWLCGDWGLLFSHPADFEDDSLERDRWLEILRDDFRAQGVRPIACQRSAGDLDLGWVGELIDDYRLVSLASTNTVTDAAIELPPRRLGEDILGLPARFVLIIDESLRRRGVLKYSAGGSSVSPLDLLASIGAMRRQLGADRVVGWLRRVA
jgi:hypothetical protein